jgi:TetR/AcrR family tetracycline transcriptional repressor
MPRPRKSHLPALSRDLLVREALALIDEQGFSALTMRRLAGRLGVDPMALYYYVPGKDALVRLLIEAVFAGMRPVTQEGDWRRRLYDWADSYVDVARQHPNLILQMLSEPKAVEAAVRANRSLFEAIEEGGFPPELAQRSAGVLVDFVNGFLLGGETGTANRDYFRFGLGVVVDGLEAARQREPEARGARGAQRRPRRPRKR